MCMVRTCVHALYLDLLSGLCALFYRVYHERIYDAIDGISGSVSLAMQGGLSVNVGV